MLSELGLDQNSTVVVSTDNQSTIKIISGSKITQRTKHIDIQYFRLRDLYSNGSITVPYIPSDQNPADILTKPIAGPRLKTLSESIGLTSAKSRGKVELNRSEIAV